VSPATATSSVDTITVVVGAVVIAVSPATVVATATVTIVPGAIAVAVSEAVVVASSPALTLVASVAILVGEATVVSSSPSLTLVATATISVGVATVTASSPSVTIMMGIFIDVSPATIAASSPSLTVVPGAVTINVTAAIIVAAVTQIITPSVSRYYMLDKKGILVQFVDDTYFNGMQDMVPLPLHDVDNIVTGTNQYILVDGSRAFTGNVTMNQQLLFTGTSSAGLRLKSLTTAERDALTPAAGDTLMNSDTGKAQVYTGSVWADLH